MLAKLLRYARPGLPCNRQTIRRALPRATRSSLEVARGDAPARPCPPKAPPSTPPRDLVQRTSKWHRLQSVNLARAFNVPHRLKSVPHLNPQSRNRRLVLFGIRIRKHALLESFQLPNFQVTQITEHHNVTHNLRALSQQRMNQDAS